MFKPTTIVVTFEDGTTSTFVHTFESDASYVRQTIQDMIDEDADLSERMSEPVPDMRSSIDERYPLDLDPRYDDRLTSRDY